MPSAGATPTAAAASSTRCATPPPTSSSPPTRWAKTPPRRRAGAPMIEGLRAGERRAHRSLACAALQLRRPRRTAASPATRSPRRCSPTACTSWAARSSTTGRAACWPPAPRSPTRWSRCAATRRATRRTCAPRRSSCTRGSRRTARTAGRPGLRCRRRQRPARAVHPGGLLLQNLHVAAGRVEVALRAAHPRGGRLRKRAHAGRSRSLRRALRALRRAGRRRRPRRSRRGRRGRRRRARASCCATSSREFGGSLLAHDPQRRGPIDGRPAAEWLARTVARRSRPTRA